MAFSLSSVPLKIDQLQFLEQFEIHSKIQWKVQGVPTYPCPHVCIIPRSQHPAPERYSCYNL